jgi:hypothetical protein
MFRQLYNHVYGGYEVLCAMVISHVVKPFITGSQHLCGASCPVYLTASGKNVSPVIESAVVPARYVFAAGFTTFEASLLNHAFFSSTATRIGYTTGSHEVFLMNNRLAEYSLTAKIRPTLNSVSNRLPLWLNIKNPVNINITRHSADVINTSAHFQAENRADDDAASVLTLFNRNGAKNVKIILQKIQTRTS